MTGTLLTAIDIGTSKICALVAQTTPSGFEILGLGIVPARGVRRGVVIDLEEATASIQEAVDKAERLAGYEIGTAFVNLSGVHIKSFNSNGVVGISGNRGIDSDDIDRALDAASAIAVPPNREIVHIVPRGFVVDEQAGVRSPMGMHGFRLEVEAHIVTAAKNVVQNITKCVENAGVVVEGFLVNSLASAEICLNATEREMGVVLCDIGSGTTDIAIYIDGNVWYTSVLEVGGQHITNDISHGLHIPADVAEQIKLQFGYARRADINPGETFNLRVIGEPDLVTYKRADLVEIIEARVEEIFLLVLQEIKRSGFDTLLPAGIVITGGTAQLGGIREVASHVMRLPARIAEPRDLLGLTDNLKGPAFSSAVGLLNWAGRETHAEAMRPKRKDSVGGGLRFPKASGFWDFLKRLAP
ncbi:MAG TPA: cell division protein FtsA [Anaerolineales bacterium]|nr:cell division protein FtsA [Anaerolineales bacterium]